MGLSPDLASEVRARFGPFIATEVNPGAGDRDARSTPLSKELVRGAAEAGMLGYMLPKAIGGRGASLYEWAVVLEQIGYLCEDGSFPLIVSLRAAVANALYETGRADLLDRYVRPMARADLFGSFAYSDGADPFAFRSSARRDGDHHVLTGEKLLVTGGTTADIFMTYLRAESGDLVVLIVERADPGVDVTPVEVTGLRAAGLGTLRLDEVRVPNDRVIAETDGLGHAQRFLNSRRALLACGPLGRMQAIFEMCIESLGETIRYGKTLLDMQNVQATLGRMYVAIETSRAIIYRSMKRAIGEEPGFDEQFDPLVSAAKYYTVDRAINVVTRALRLLGGQGYLKQHKLERYARDFYGLLAGGGAQDVLEVDLGVRAAADLGLVQARSRRRP